MFPKIEGDAYVGVQASLITQNDLVLVLIVLLIIAVAIWIIRAVRH